MSWGHTEQDTTFNLLGHHQTAFHSGCTIFHSHRQCARVPISPCFHQILFSPKPFEQWCLYFIVTWDSDREASGCSVTEPDLLLRTCTPDRPPPPLLSGSQAPQSPPAFLDPDSAPASTAQHGLSSEQEPADWCRQVWVVSAGCRKAHLPGGDRGRHPRSPLRSR